MDLPAKSARARILNVPPVLIGLVAALCLIHLVMALLPADDSDAVLDLFAFDPLRYGTSGAGAGEAWPGGIAADVWTFVTYAFFHFNVIHLAFNLIWFVVFGTPVARRFGAWRFLAFFAFTAAGGALAHLLTHLGENVPAIGASAAVLGMMAAALRFVFEPAGPLDPAGLGGDGGYRVPAKPLIATLRDRRMLLFVLGWLGLSTLLAMPQFAMPGTDVAVAWQAHIGGFVAGLVGFSAFDPVVVPRPATAESEPQDQTPPRDDVPSDQQ
jgi:membrane associated rhomboid family serine protease